MNAPAPLTVDTCPKTRSPRLFKAILIPLWLIYSITTSLIFHKPELFPLHLRHPQVTKARGHHRHLPLRWQAGPCRTGFLALGLSHLQWEAGIRMRRRHLLLRNINKAGAQTNSQAMVVEGTGIPVELITDVDEADGRILMDMYIYQL
jgi:hypothetical protein